MTSINGVSDTDATHAANAARRGWGATAHEIEIAHQLSEATAKAIVANAKRKYAHDHDSGEAESMKRVMADTLHCTSSGVNDDPLPESQTALAEAGVTQHRMLAWIANFYHMRGRFPRWSLIRGERYNERDLQLDEVEA